MRLVETVLTNCHAAEARELHIRALSDMQQRRGKPQAGRLGGRVNRRWVSCATDGLEPVASRNPGTKADVNGIDHLSLGLAAVSLAQEATTAGAPVTEIPPQILIQVPNQGIGYNQEGHPLVVAVMTNLGTQRSLPMDLIAIVLNDCILPDVPQTCRFAAFGSFHDVTPEGIGPGETVQWTFDFGRYPELDLSRWSIIWSQVR